MSVLIWGRWVCKGTSLALTFNTNWDPLQGSFFSRLSIKYSIAHSLDLAHTALFCQIYEESVLQSCFFFWCLVFNRLHTNRTCQQIWIKSLVLLHFTSLCSSLSLAISLSLSPSICPSASVSLFCLPLSLSLGWKQRKMKALGWSLLLSWAKTLKREKGMGGGR